MDYPENRNPLPRADTVSVPPKTQSDFSDPRGAAALYTNVDRRRFLRVSGLVAGAALAGTVAFRQCRQGFRTPQVLLDTRYP